MTSKKEKTISTEPHQFIDKPAWLLTFTVFLLISGLALVLLGFYRSYTLVVDGQAYKTKALVFRVSTLLKSTGLELGKEDWISAPLHDFNLNIPSTVYVNRARPVSILVGSKQHQLNSTKTFPIDIFESAGLRLFPNDVILQNGKEIDPYAPIALGQALVFKYLPAKLITLSDDQSKTYFSTQAGTVAEALAEKGIQLGEFDRVSIAPQSRLQSENQVTIRRARQIAVTIGEQTITAFSAAETPEEALLEIGLPLQNLNELASTPETTTNSSTWNEKLKVIQVNEVFEWIKEETAYQNTYELDPNAELDSTSVLVPGQTGYVVTRNITRVEDGQTVQTFPSQHWKASDPIDGILGRGTLPVIKTETVDGVTLEYWRKVSVYATSYHPAEFGGSTRTRSGMPLTKGIIAVSSAWYPSMVGQPVYVPGYGHGVIGDSGGGIPGRYWIDLGYDDENYVGWHHWTTLYFLSPIPAYIPAVLP